MTLAQQNEKQTFAEQLHTKERKRNVIRIAKQMMNERKEVIGVNCLKNEDGEVVVESEGVKQRWKDYMERLLNIENDWNGFDRENVYEGTEKFITEGTGIDCIIGERWPIELWLLPCNKIV